jgi:hypothetical protein
MTGGPATVLQKRIIFNVLATNLFGENSNPNPKIQATALKIRHNC